MKKGKIALWIIVIGFIGLVIGQNWEFFKAENSLNLNLFFAQYETPLLANAVFFVAFFFIGYLIAYFFSLIKQFKDGKHIKALKAKEASLVETISAMEKELAKLKSAPASDPSPSVADEEAPAATEAAK